MGRRTLALALALLLAVLLLAGCKRSNVATNFGTDLEEWRPDKQDEEELGRISDIAEYDSPEFGDILGFDVVEYPDDEDLSPHGFYVIDEWFGQMDYSAAEDWTLVLRVAREDEVALLTVYNELHRTTGDVRQVGGVEVEQREADIGCAIVTWKKDGYQYSLHSNKLQGAIPPQLVDRMVEGMACRDR